jgi:transposase-like protein
VSTGAKPACPFCGERERVRLISPIGGQLITAHWRCDACNTYFEAIRDEFERRDP